MMSEKAPVKTYDISITRESDKIAVASGHGSTLKMSMDGMDPTIGLTAPETAIAAYGACIMTNIGKAAKALSLKINDVKINFTATKRNEPLGLENLRCKITLKSGEPKDKLQELLSKAVSDGTATNALKEGLKAAFDFVVN
jgi:uncharacterized OsmC-like protein